MINALLPLDNFVVINKSILSDHSRNCLMYLYQPIIGGVAINLYLTLWNYLDDDKIVSKSNTHADLVTMMQTTIEDIKEAKDKLEAIGLIKTYVKKQDVNNYVYELYEPLSAYDFINNPILNTALYNNLNKKEYKRIIDKFTIPKIDLKEYKDISCTFKDVFNFVSTSKSTNNIKKLNHLGLSFEPNIDFNSILSLIPEEILNVRSITKQMKELMYQLAFIYDLNNEQFSEILKNSIEDRKVNIELLKEGCRKFYSFENKGNIPKMVYQSQPLYLRQENVENTRKSILINQFETTSPSEFLELKQGSKPTKKDLEIIEYLMIEHNLNPGVVNVLIDYVLKINNNKLVKSFIEQIAVQWKRSKIKTVTDAIEFAQQEYDLKNNKQTKPIKKETLPSWIDKKVDEDLLTDEELLEFEKELGV